MLQNAQSVKKAKITKGRKEERKVVSMVGAERIAHLDQIIKIATSARDKEEEIFTERVRSEFMKEIRRTKGKKPDGFNAVEGHATINCSFRRRSLSSTLNEKEQQLLADAGVDFKKEVITPELYGINPAYATDEQIMKRVERALASLGLPEDFFVKQEETSKFIIDETSLTQALKTKDIEIVKIATTIALKPKLDEIVPAEMVDTIEDVLNKSMKPASVKVSVRKSNSIK